MSLVDGSPRNSSSSDDFAAFLDAELDSTSDTPPRPEDDDDGDDDDDDDNDNDDGDSDSDSDGDGDGDGDGDDDDDETYKSHIERAKRRKVSVLESTKEPNGSTTHMDQANILEASVKVDICTHPGFIGGMCIKCGDKMDSQSGVAFGYIHKDLRLGNDEIVRLRDRDLKNLLRHKKLYLVLDLDHTLLNSTRLSDVTQEEGYLLNQDDPMQDKLRGSLFKLPFMHMLTKLRPFVHTFLKEASNLFEMYIYTMGERAYALEMANLLDPGKAYFDSRVIAQGDCTQRHQKGLDVVLGQESAVLILDDTEPVWVKHKDNLILMERYHFFASSCKQFGYNSKSLSELRSDESDVEGALATILNVLKRVHSMFFNPELGDNFAGRDARQMLQAVRREVLKGCKIVFSRVFPTKFQAENHHLWVMAERLGATCSTEVDPSVTHVISTDIGTEKSRWAVEEKKFLIEPRWLEAANFRWQRQPEEKFPVKEMSSASQKVKLRILGGGYFQQNDKEWDYFTDQPMVRAMVPATITHQRLVNYVREKCGMDSIVGTIKIIYKYSGQIVLLRDNADVSYFLQNAMALTNPPTLYVYDDYTMGGGSNVGGGSNIGGAPDVYAPEQNQTPYVPQFPE